MLYKGKRIANVNIYKVKGSKDYMLVDEANPGYMTALAPIVEVDSNDAEHINKIIHRLRVNAGCGFMASWEVSWSYLHDHCYQVSWAKVPKAWKGLYKGEIIHIINQSNSNSI